ncbi:uncharacterized protein MYCFIDRAFT_31107 [Pseudocercospora fijiensis CIRAD86]|uniref:Enoyl reductase (ER) domain-containing protein n=1 Tax=Pseudocercospora fijiensis (strain CIRAD86) TaxID=383855 RepID=M3A6I5_PSEFD|nr:uncharacterized protein MYCFIDRAFT_31107 [Pseudocercospora fijiensis CIRAD86]EME80211.1 hypothetical protein MYCFIDRAFT_31107 [Pseudocercospora fijiensis CIRAD86]
MANQAWKITAPGEVTLVDLDTPKPGPKQALIRLQAASLNYRDILVMNHDPSYPAMAKQDLIPCSDGAGVVEEAGPGSEWKAGDRVIIQPNTWVSGFDPRDFDIFKTMGGGAMDGTLRRYLVWDDDRLIKAPDGLSIEESSTLYTAGATAWNALMHGLFKLEPGMTVLTQGTGGVSCYAIQIAAAKGATVIATSSSDDKLQVAKKLGAKHLINYRKTPYWADEVLKVTDGKGVDIVADVVGAASIEQAIKATRQAGLIRLLGVLGNSDKASRSESVRYCTNIAPVQPVLGAGSRELSQELAGFLYEHQIHPPVAATFDFEQADKALEALKTLSAPGKIVVKI